VTSAAELIAAMEEQARRGPTAPFPRVRPFTTSLHAGKPSEPPEPTGIVPAEPHEPPAAPPAAPEAPDAVRVWRLTADIGVWRRPKNR
jgi:hypothetical protein